MVYCCITFLQKVRREAQCYACSHKLSVPGRLLEPLPLQNE